MNDRKTEPPSVFSHRSPDINQRAAFTLVELLVVIAIIGVLVGMALPAMQNLREMSRRTNCEQNLAALSLAISNYSLQQTHYPIGTLAENGPIRSVAEGYHHNWLQALLPHLDADLIHRAIDNDVSVYAPANEDVRTLRLPQVLCPSANDIRANSSCYAGIHASTETPIDETNDGVFHLNTPVSDEEITDGISHTMFIGEKLSDYEDDLGWISGTRATLRNTGHAVNAERFRIRQSVDQKEPITPLFVGGIASDHAGGAYVLFGDGRYEFLSESTDQTILQQAAAIADGQLPKSYQAELP